MRIAVLDYEAGNLHSVEKALRKLNAKYLRTRNELEIDSCDALILPGVGSFTNIKAISALRIPIRSFVRTRPFLGICLGMQLLFERSEESPEKGLGLLPGKVEKIKGKVKIPHMGWNNLRIEKESILLDGISEKDYLYFVHSYACPITDATVASCQYGIRFSAAVEKGNVFGVQFHPEKSGEKGLKILKNFLEMI